MSEQTMELDSLRQEITERAKELTEKATEFARTQPHVAVGVAFGVGWILGNGLPPRLVMAAARLGWKAMLGGALGSGALGLINNAQDSDDELSKPMSRARGTEARAERRPEPAVTAAGYAGQASQPGPAHRGESIGTEGRAIRTPNSSRE